MNRCRASTRLCRWSVSRSRARRFWRRVFRLVRIPGGRYLLGVLARRTARTAEIRDLDHKNSRLLSTHPGETLRRYVELRRSSRMRQRLCRTLIHELQNSQPLGHGRSAGNEIYRRRAPCRGRLVRPLWPVAANAHAEPARRGRARRLRQSGLGIGRMGSRRRARHHQGNHRECPVGCRGIPGVVRTLDADRAVYSLRDSRRAHRVARRRQPDRPPVGHANRGAAAADRAPAGAAGVGVPAARAVAALETRLPRTRSRRARTRPRSHARDFLASIGGRERCRRIRPHHEDRARAHGLRARGAVGAGQEHRACR